MSHHPGTLLTSVRELPFVDREEEFALLKSLFDQAVAGKGQVVFVAGEGGIGKTRLVHELGHYARSRGVLFAVGPSYEEERLVPYSPWIEVIRAIFRSSPEISGKAFGPTVAEVARLVPELAAKVKELGIKGWLSGPERGGFDSATGSERVRFFQAVTDFLAHASREKPLVLFFDDVLWADAVSLQLLHYFSRRTRDMRIMVVAAFRDVEVSEEHPLSRLLLDLNRERILRRVALGRLTTRQVAEIISNHSGGGQVTPEFAKLIHSRTGGNPFFVEEVLLSLFEDGRVYKSEEGWTLKEIGQVEIPSTVRALIKQRVSRLGADVVQTLMIGAVIGMEFRYELLRTVTSEEEETLIVQLEKAVQAGLLKEERVGKEVSHVFADEQIRDFLYDELSLIRRRKIHSKIAQAMEKLLEHEKDRHLEELAYHYIQGGEVVKAIEYSLMAGDRAAKVYAHSASKRHYLNVLELLEDEQIKERLEVLTKLGDACFRMLEYKESVGYYEGAVAITKYLRQNLRTAQLYSKLGYVHWNFSVGGDKQESLKNYKQGLGVLEGEKDTIEEATISQNIARLLVNTGEVDAGLQWCERAIQIAKRLNSHEVLAHALQTLALGTRPNRKNKSEILHYLQDSLKISLEHGLEDAIVRVYTNLGTAYHFRFDYPRAKEAYLKGVEYSRKVAFLDQEAWMETAIALYGHFPLGDWDEALEDANHGLRIGPEVRGEFLTAFPLIPLAVVHLFRGGIDKAEEYLNRAYLFVESTGYREMLYPCCWALGKLYFQKKDFGKAEEYLLRGVEAGLEFGLTTPPFEAYFELVKVYCAKGDLQKGLESYEKIKGAAEELDEKGGYAFEHWARGLLASASRDLNGARDAFQKSSELWNQLKHPHNYAQTLLGLGGVLSKIGEREEAKKCINEARRIFEKLGAKLDLQKLESEAKPFT